MQPENPLQNQTPNQPIGQPMFTPDNPGQPFSPKNNKNKYILIITIAIVLISLLLAGFILFSNKNQTKNQSNSDNKEQTKVVDPVVNLENSSKVIFDNGNSDPSKRYLLLDKESIIGNLSAYINEYMANNNGQNIPDAKSLEKLLTQNPSKYEYPIMDAGSNKPILLVDNTPKQNEIQYKTAVKCQGSELIIANNNRYFTLRMLDENNTLSCYDG